MYWVPGSWFLSAVEYWCVSNIALNLRTLTGEPSASKEKTMSEVNMQNDLSLVTQFFIGQLIDEFFEVWIVDSSLSISWEMLKITNDRLPHSSKL